MSTFKDLQEDVCYKEPEEVVDVDIKVCPDCIPNLEIPEIQDWHLNFTPYYSERDCEYHCTVIVNVEGNVHYAATKTDSVILQTNTAFTEVLDDAGPGSDPENISTESGPREMKSIEASQYDFDSLLKSYIRPAIRKTLRHFGKLETDEIVCAAPPENPGEICEGIFGLDYERFIKTVQNQTGESIPNYFETLEVNESIKNTFPNITNTTALELFARVKDHKFITANRVLYVQIAIPSHKFNQVPDAPELGSLSTQTEKVVLNTREFMSQISRFKSAMRTFAGYQAYFYRQENGRIFFEETQEPFYIKFYSEQNGRIDKFLDNLNNLMLDNNFHIKRYDFENFTKDYPGEIEITFDKSDPATPFKVLNVRARKIGASSSVTERLLSTSTTEPVPVRSINCPFVDCKIGLPDFIEYSVFNQTMMGYISDINNILGQLESNVTPPWLDFIVEKTFPQLAINYGSMGNFEENSCISVNLNDMSDFIHQSVFNAFEAFSYAWNQNRCKTVDQIDKLEWSRFLDGWNEAMGSAAATNLQNAWAERVQSPKRLQDKATTFDFQGGFGFFDPKQGGVWKRLLSFLNPCEIEKMLSGAMVCLSAALTLDELYYSIFKQALDSVGAEAIRIVMNTLPADKAAKIEEAINEQFKGMPYPWDESWVAGDMSGVVDRDAARASQDFQVYLGEDIQKSIRLLKHFLEKGTSLVEEEVVAQAIIIFMIEVETTSENSDDIKITDQAKENYESNKQSLRDKFNEESGRYSKYAQQIIEELIAARSERFAPARELGVREYWNESLLASAKDFGGPDEENPFLSDLEVINQGIRAAGPAPDLGSGSNAFNGITTQELRETLEEYEKTFVLTQDGTLKLSNYKQKEIKDTIKQYQKHVDKQAVVEEKLSKKFQNWNSLSDEQKIKAAEDQSRQSFLHKTSSSDQITEGTFGKALGNIQQLLVSAYIEEIMNNITIVEMQEYYEKIPGVNVIAKLIPQFVCPTEEDLIYPKIDNFLSTLTFDPCGPGETKLSLPSIQDISYTFNWLEMLGDAFFEGLKALLSSVLMALMQKVAEILQTSIDFCDLAGNLVGKLTDGQPEGFERFLDDVLCADPKQQDDKDKIFQNIASKAVGSNPPSNAQQHSSVGLMKTISALSTQEEVKSAMVGRGDPKFFNNISNIVKELNPEYAQFFSDPSKTEQFFRSMGNFLTPEQRSAVISDLDNPVLNRNQETTICLTKEERSNWDRARQEAFADPEIGKRFVDRENERLNKNVADAAKILMSGGIEGQLQDAINQAFAPKDQDCQVNKGLIPTVKDYPQNVQQTISNGITGIFKRLERAFIDDTIEANYFSSLPIFGSTNTPGVLSVILSNNRSNTLNYHMTITKNPILNIIFNTGFWNGPPMELPETVGRHMLEYIENKLEIEYNIDGKLELRYDNEREQNAVEGFINNQRYKSAIEINENPSILRNYLIHDIEENIKTRSNNPDARYDSGYSVDPLTPGNMRSKSLLSMFQSIFSPFQQYDPLENADEELIGMNNLIYKNLSKSLFYRRSGQISEGFLYGNQDTPILEESDLVYVNPEPGSTEYTYEEEDEVLGRSLTNNPRVYFLDPRQFGGTYLAPNIYVSEATHKGWLGFSRIIVPNPTGCDPKNSNFLFLDKLIKGIQDKEGKIKNHDLLEYSPECTFELPFDKIANSNTLATLEAIVRATCRIHIVDFLIRSYPVFSNVHLNMDLNFNNILLDYIGAKISRSLIEERSIFASTYEGITYYLLFLEQVAQTVIREVEQGNIERDQSLENILDEINQAQILHKQECFITENNLKYVNNPGDFPANLSVNDEGINFDGVQGTRERFETMNEIMKSGIAIIGQNSDYDFLSFLSNMNMVAGANLTQARFACKIYRINTLRPKLELLVKYVIKQEFEIYRQEMLEKLSPRPYIYDISKYFIGGSKILLGKTVDAGTYDTEFPIGGGIGNFPYGDVNDCPDQFLIHPLNGIEITSEKFDEIEKNGGFYLEKYLKCKEKKGAFRNFPDKFKGVVQIEELKNFLRSRSFSGELDGELFVSDYFGNARLSDAGDSFTGEIGIKFGVRLCYFPPRPTGVSQSEETNRLRSYRLNICSFNVDGSNKQIPSTGFSFPICSYEQDIMDVQIKELLSSNSLLNQDLKCYIDKLVETNNYRHLMENVLDIKKMPSIMMIYSYRNFLLSLGAFEGERLEGQDDLDIPPENISKVFNDSRAEARRLFASYYKNNDRDPPNEEENNEDIVQAAQRELMNSLSFINFGDWSFDIRRRIRTENPMDKDGNPCKNAFANLYKINR